MAENEVVLQEVAAEEPKKKYDPEKGIKPYLYDGKRKFNISKFNTADVGDFDSREDAVEEFVDNLHRINVLQQKLYAERKEGVIFVFQAMDAAGKDGVIRTVFSTLSPHGVKEFCFKVPSAEEASHDFLWRFYAALPPRGSISIFNRSYYEDVLVGKVHELYKNKIRPDRLNDYDVIKLRYQLIKNYEKTLYLTGTRVVKIFLNVSKDEQGRRFIARIDTPKKNWKLSSGDLKEREYWDQYMDAFESMVNTTSTKDSPWYVVPADHKWYARLVVSRIVLQTLLEIDPQYPTIAPEEWDAAMANRQAILDSISDKEADNADGSSEFSKTGDIAAGILLDEEAQKAAEKREKIKDEGFRNVEKLLAKGIMVKTPADIIGTFGDEKAKKEEEKLAKKVAKEAKKLEKASKLPSPALMEIYEKFGIICSVKLRKPMRKFLKAVNEIEERGEKANLLSICSSLDIRPSEYEPILQDVVALELAETDAEGNVSLTENGKNNLFADKESRKNEERFKKFLGTLSESELNDFVSLCDSAVAPENKPEADNDIVEL